MLPVILLLRLLGGAPEDWMTVVASPEGVLGADASTLTMEGERRGIRAVWVGAGEAPMLTQMVGRCDTRTVRHLAEDETLAAATSGVGDDADLQQPTQLEEALLASLCDRPYLFDTKLLPAGSGLTVATDRVPGDLAAFVVKAPEMMDRAGQGVPVQCVSGRWARSPADC